ncbi:hypothetical protein ACHAWU_001247 [Discostella pseudostelligera]|uniref:Uncharacterized protein n=1 Tax=Discostella pseudostelligera TaxID=259834 RepID=A0ABD3MCE5_9STRA
MASSLRSVASLERIITCLSDSDDDNDTAAPRKVSLDPPAGGGGGGGLKSSSASLLDDDDEIEVMDGELYRSQQLQAASASAAGNAAGNSGAVSSAAAAKSTDNDDEEELEIVGTHNEQRLPHNRQDCLDYRFCASTSTNSNSNVQSDNNSNFCSLCYCYVCDKPASECNNWVNGTKGVCSDIAAAAAADGGGKKGSSANTNSTNATNQQPHMNHCNATNKGSQSTLWKNMRNAIKKGKDPSKVSASHDESYNPHDAPNASLQRYLQNYGVYMPSGGGPLHRSDQHYQVRAANHAAASQHTMNPYAAAMLASATSANQAMLMAAMNHALSRGPPPLGTTVPPARSSGSGRGGRRTYTIRSGSAAAAAAMSAAVAAAIASGSSSAASSAARSSSRGRSRSRSTSSAAATIAAAASAASSRRRNRPESGGEDSNGNKRPAPHDHQARMRTQQMLEDLYG